MVWERHTLDKSKRPNAPKSSAIWSTQCSKFVSLMIESTISTTYSLYVSRQRMALWGTRSFPIISPLPTPWLGLGGDSCFGRLSPTGVPDPFLCKRSSLPSFFRFDVPLTMTLEADAEGPSFYLRAAVNCLTSTLYLPASISAKDKKRM